MNNKGAKQSSLIFVKNDKLSDEAQNAWKELHIDPAMLIPKSKESFKEPGVLENIVEIRYYHYEDKRKQLVAEVEEFIKSQGMPPPIHDQILI